MSEQPPAIAWRRSSSCHQGSCVEVVKAGSIVLVRDSKNPGVYQAWSQREWGELLGCVKVDWRDGFLVLADGCVELGLERHDDKLTFTAAEWKAFEEDVIDDRFEFGNLPEFKEISGPVSVTVDGAGREVEPESTAGSDQAATGAVSGCVARGVAVPVAAELPGWVECQRDLADAFRSGPSTGPSPVNPLRIMEGRHDHDPASLLTASRVLPETAHLDAAGTRVPPGSVPAALNVDATNDGGIVWEFDDGSLERRVASLTNLERAYELVLAQLRVGFGGNSAVARWIVADLHEAGLIVDDKSPDADELLRRAAAPLVPTDGAS